MTDYPDLVFPAEAYVDSKTLWWHLSTWPGGNQKFGDEPRIAAWLAFNKKVGQTFTTEELRKALGNQLSPTSRNNAEHFQRRIRQLRSDRDGWVFPSIKHDRTLDMGSYRLERIGWHPALGERPKKLDVVSAKTRRKVYTRDGYRCLICGVGANEPYPRRSDSHAVLTIGHVIPEALGGSGHISNLRTECAECNEPARSDTGVPPSHSEVMVLLHNFKMTELTKLHSWILAGRRYRDRVDEAYDQIRMLRPEDRDAVILSLSRMIGRD